MICPVLIFLCLPKDRLLRWELSSAQDTDLSAALICLFPSSQKVISFLPGTYGTSLLRNHALRGVFAEMEKKGFIASDITDKPMTTLPALFAGAFLAHHRFVKGDVIDNIYSKLTKKEDLIGKLAEMYNEPILTLVEEPEEAEERKAHIG